MHIEVLIDVVGDESGCARPWHELGSSYASRPGAKACEAAEAEVALAPEAAWMPTCSSRCCIRRAPGALDVETTDGENGW